MIVKEADEEFDRNVPGIDSEYRIGYDLTKELPDRKRSHCNRGAE